MKKSRFTEVQVVQANPRSRLQSNGFQGEMGVISKDGYCELRLKYLMLIYIRSIHLAQNAIPRLHIT